MSLIWAHRGASGYCPENTLDAFDRAVQQGAQGVELDVQLSADGQVVVIHDGTVDRVAGEPGRVAEMTLAALKRLDAGRVMPGHGIARIPTLAEVFALLRPTDLTVNVELKLDAVGDQGLEAACIALAREKGFAERVWFSSFNHQSLLRVKGIAPEFPCGLLYGNLMVRPWDYAKAIGMEALHPHYSELYIPDEIPQSHALGIRVHTWTVNDEAVMRKVAKDGVDAIITNYPDVALRVVMEG